ncbi:RING-type domain-containing protein [Pycnococcus provasolii]
MDVVSSTLVELKALAACELCLNRIDAPTTVPTCGHTFCRACILDKLEGVGVVESKCPACGLKVWKKDLIYNRKRSVISDAVWSLAERFLDEDDVEDDEEEEEEEEQEQETGRGRGKRRTRRTREAQR